ncbi:MAG: ABC transporter permease [Bacteroidales bacterium]|nr:ABC transporter permease [Bacteroidales bacterium]
MWQSFFKSGLRILRRQKNYTFLNLFGLTIGLVAFIFIFLYIRNEISYDRGWKNYHHLFRVTQEYATGDHADKMALTSYALAGLLETSFPDKIIATRLFFTDPSDNNAVSSVRYQGKYYDIPNLTIADNNFFKVFNYSFTEGNPDSCLSKPNSIVISEEVKKQIFGQQNALGKKVKTSIRTYTVTGVFKEKEQPSHLQFNALISFSSLEKEEIQNLKRNWLWFNSYTYIRTKNPENYILLEKLANNEIKTKLNEYIKQEKINLSGYYGIRFQPIYKIHFESGLLYDSHSNTQIFYLYLFGIIAFFILLTASINYVNLTTARAIKRARETGIRKIIGASRRLLLKQYISESLLLTLAAFLLAMSMVELILPVFNNLVQKHLVLIQSLTSGYGIIFGALLLFIVFLLALLSGSFPALILYRLKPSAVLRGNSMIISRGKRQYTTASIRKFLVIFQYIIAIGVIISTAIIAAQIHFVKNQNLGFNQNNLFIVNSPPDTSFVHRVEPFIKSIEEISGVQMVTTSTNLPGYLSGKLLLRVGDNPKSEIHTLNNYIVGKDFFKILEIPFINGRSFSSKLDKDTTENIVINEAAVKYLNLNDSSIGTTIQTPSGTKGKVIGIIKNFNFSSLHQSIQPLAFVYRPQFPRYVMVRYKAGEKKYIINKLHQTWDLLNPGYNLYYTDLSQKISGLYQTDQRMLSLFIYFSLIVLLISSLGLYGLSAFLIEQRSKEISIRKILGGSDMKILWFIAKEYLWLVLVAGIIASPVVYYFTYQWLNRFAYHIPLNILYFPLGILFVLMMALLTVWIKSYSILRQNPSAVIKYE